MFDGGRNLTKERIMYELVKLFDLTAIPTGETIVKIWSKMSDGTPWLVQTTTSMYELKPMQNG